MAKQSKRTKKFIKNHLDRTIKDRKDRQKKRAVVERSHAAKQKKALLDTHRGGRANGRIAVKDDGHDESDNERGSGADSGAEEDEDADGGAMKGMSVEDFLGGGFKASMDEDDDGSSQGGASEDDEDDIEDLSDDEGAHAQDLAKLAQKDPEFFKYLQENDRDLLDFGAGEEEGSEQDSEADVKSKKAKGKEKASEANSPIVTLQMLKGWQNSMLKFHSLKAWRRLLLAFRSAAHMEDEDGPHSKASRYIVNNAQVFSKILLTTLKYSPMVVQHHLPYKELSSGKFKIPSHTQKASLLQRPLKSYWSTLHHLLKTLPDTQQIYDALFESARMVPYLLPYKRQAREHIKIVLDLWATSKDEVRIAAFLSVRKIARGGDSDMMDLCLRATYHALLRSSKLASAHSMAGITLMKNSASELYLLDPAASYQQAFGFIRQLAILLRNAMKAKTDEAQRNLCNWQFVHCVDFWSVVLATSCSAERGEESLLQPLIYPLVQIATGVTSLIPQSRFYPMRLHLVRSMLRLMQRTHVYIPLAPALLEIFDSAEFQRKPKPSDLKPLDFDATVRAPAAYARTRSYADQVAEETTYVLLEFLTTQARSIALPELAVAIQSRLRRSVKTARHPKLSAVLKPLQQKLESNVAWVQSRRANVDFAPNDRRQVVTFLRNEKGEAPLEAAARLARKVREQKRLLLQQTAQRVDEDSEEGSEVDDSMAHEEDDDEEMEGEEDDESESDFETE